VSASLGPIDRGSVVSGNLNIFYCVPLSVSIKKLSLLIDRFEDAARIDLLLVNVPATPSIPSIK